MSGSVVWVDGELSADGDGRVSALDHAVTVGDGVFETMLVAEGEPFAMRRHLRRLRTSAAVLGLEIGRSDDELRHVCAEVLAAGDDLGRLRITVTGGVGPLGSGRGSAPATVVVAASPSTAWPATSKVVVVPWVRNERSAVAGAKTISYAENVVALAFAHERGADEAVFANTVGQLCEGTGTNVFVAQDGKVRTPSLASGCLAGITRELVLELVEDVEESDSLTLEDLRSADEAFLTSSTRDVHPISSIDGAPLDAPGPVTASIAEAFRTLRAKNPDP